MSVVRATWGLMAADAFRERHLGGDGSSCLSCKLPGCCCRQMPFVRATRGVMAVAVFRESHPGLDAADAFRESHSVVDGSRYLS